MWPLVPYVTKEQEPASFPFLPASLTVLEVRDRRSRLHGKVGEEKMEKEQKGAICGRKRKREEDEKNLVKRARLQGSV